MKNINEITEEEISLISAIITNSELINVWHSKEQFLETILTEVDDMRMSFKSCMIIRKWLVENNYQIPE